MTLALLAAIPLAGQGRRAHDVAAELGSVTLDPAACYRVHDLRIARPGLTIYFNSGYLIFAKPVNGIRPGAYFASTTDAGDGEVLVVPPNRAERLSLTRFTGSPTLDAHFQGAFLVLGDGSAGALAASLADERVTTPAAGKEDVPAILSAQASPALRVVLGNFTVRLVLDLLSNSRAGGVFVLSALGTAAGGFDAVYDPAHEPNVTVGQFAERNQRQYFDVWTSFSPGRTASGVTPPPPSVPSSYRIDASFDSNLTLDASSTVIVDSPAAIPAAMPCFISAHETVLSARIDGEPAEVFQPIPSDGSPTLFDGGQDFLLVPAHPLAKGRHTIEFRHRGNVIRRTPDGLLFVESRGTWYPQISMGLAIFDLHFQFPADLTLVATGDVVEDTVTGGRRSLHVVTPVPVRFAGFNLGKFQTSELLQGPLRLRICANPPPMPPPAIAAPPPPLPFQKRASALPPIVPLEPYRDALHRISQNTASTFAYLSSLLGPPPLRTNTISPIPSSFGQGFPGLVYLSNLAYLDPARAASSVGPRSAQVFFFDLLETHEIAHQWWGNLVVPASDADEWLVEALANYCALMYLEQRKGRAAVQQVLEEYRKNLLARDSQGGTIESAGPIVWGARLRSSSAPEAWRVITYEKGSWIIHMLRLRMGDERFHDFLRTLCTRFADSPMSTQQFEAAAREFLPGGTTLGGFFDNWVYGTGIPSLKLSYSVRNGRLVGSLQQRDVDPGFSTYVPVEIHDASASRTVLHWVETGDEPVAFSYPVRSRNARAAIAPGMLDRGSR
jgi:hypothetical protein